MKSYVKQLCDEMMRHSDVYERTFDELRSDNTKLRDEIRELKNNSLKWNWGHWVLYVIPTIASVMGAALVLMLAWQFIHWAAQP